MSHKIVVVGGIYLLVSSGRLAKAKEVYQESEAIIADTLDLETGEISEDVTVSFTDLRRDVSDVPAERDNLMMQATIERSTNRIRSFFGYV